jgi:hypothetical protein
MSTTSVKIEAFANSDEIIQLPGRYRAWFAFCTTGSIGFHIGLIVAAPIPGSSSGETRHCRLAFGTLEVHHPCDGTYRTQVRLCLSGAEDLASAAHERRLQWSPRALNSILEALDIAHGSTEGYSATFAFSTAHVFLDYDPIALDASNVA